MNKYKVDINKEYSLLIKQAELPSVVSIEGLSQPMTEVALYILESGGYQKRDGVTVTESGYDLSIAGEVFVKPAAGYIKIVTDKEYEAYPVGQLWYDNSSGGLFIYKGEGSDGTGRWSLLIQDSELERYQDRELERYHELLNRINALENMLTSLLN